MMKKIMKRAHELARMMEGDYAARMALALRQAWREARQVSYAVNHQPSGGKEWVAEIVGRHPKYNFERRFLTPIARDWSRSGKTGTTTFLLEEGKVYEVNVPWKGRRFVTVFNGEIEYIAAETVAAKIS